MNIMSMVWVTNTEYMKDLTVTFSKSLDKIVVTEIGVGIPGNFGILLL